MTFTEYGLSLAALGTAIALLSPVALARPRLVAKTPRHIMLAWILALAVGSLSLTTGLVMMIGSALAHHVEHVAGHDALTAISEIVLGWLSVAVMGIIAFRLGSTVSDIRSERREIARELHTLVGSGEVIHLSCGKALRVSSNQIFIVASHSYRHVIFSSALEAQLTPKQLCAAVSHEQAHLTQHHHLLLSVGRIVSASVPFIPASKHLYQAMRIATELAADDAAVAACGVDVTCDALLLAYPKELGVAERVARLRNRRLVTTNRP